MNARDGVCVVFAVFLSVALTSEGVAQSRESHAELVDFQRDIVRRLAGGAELSPGVRLETRADLESRVFVRDFIGATLESMGLEELRQAYSDSGENVYALLPATVPSEEYVVLGAHFDSSRRSPGANDNATGCAVVLAVARNLVSLTHRSRNIYIVLFDEEERGLRGSKAFAEMLQAEGTDVVAVHTVDQMGWDADGDGAIELEIPYEGAVDIYREAALASGFSSEIHVTQEAGSDHSAFRRLDMPAVGITEEYRNDDTTPHIHRPTDTWDTVDVEYMASTTRLVQAAMTLLLRAP
jgi:acetylornithine deacetylase/succinyl-diaminopimelate desuccinylase-like protein